MLFQQVYYKSKSIPKQETVSITDNRQEPKPHIKRENQRSRPYLETQKSLRGKPSWVLLYNTPGCNENLEPPPKTPDLQRKANRSPAKVTFPG